MGFRGLAHAVRNSDMAHGDRVARLARCVRRYHPIGHRATLSFLAEVAGDYQRREAPLLRALDVLEASRAAWLVEVTAYADERAKQKLHKQYTLAPQWPLNSMSGHWYSTDPRVSRLAALHALKLWERDQEEAPAPDDVRSLVRSCIANGRLTDEQLDVVLSRAEDEEVRWPMTLMASANGKRVTRAR